MSSRHLSQAEKDKKKIEQDKLLIILNQLLKEEENKYCADCEAKGPRWASWNLGVFLCIRCAGIHRNLGVHVSKVKSVNLDTWTAEQVQHMRVGGNSVGKAVYEATLPEHFRRPQTDSTLEAFVRGKYEHKRYIMKDYVPPRINVQDLLSSEEFQRAGSLLPTSSDSSQNKNSKKSLGTSASAKILTNDPKTSTVAAPVTQTQRQSTGKERVRRRSSTSNSTNGGAGVQNSHLGQEKSAEVTHSTSALNDLVDLQLGIPAMPILTPAPIMGMGANGGLMDDLLGLDVPAQAPAQANGPKESMESNQQLLFANTTQAEGGGKKTKDDILALYGGGAGAPGGMAGQQQPYGSLTPMFTNFQQANSGIWPGENTNVTGVYGQQPLLYGGQGTGFVQTPFGLVPATVTQMQTPQHQQPQHQQQQQQPLGGVFQPTTSNNSNFHLQSIQQQLASLQLQRNQQQQQQHQQQQVQQNTLATNLWY